MAGDPPQRVQTLVPTDGDDWSGRILGDYRFLSRIGRGGMGEVYRAVHLRLGRDVAVKVLTDDRINDPRAVARFEREMTAIGRLEHPNIVRCTDARQVGSALLLVMELVDGVDLGELVKRVGPLPVADACEAARQVAAALQHAHGRGLVHRDIKPSNLMLTATGVVKVLDLGLALVIDEIGGARELTAAGSAMGTMDYMAPEQWSDSHAVDTRADLYSLGCTLYHLLSGGPPFQGPEYRTLSRKMAAHLREPAPPIQARRPEVPDALAAVLDRLLAKDPTGRYATPAELVEVLAPFCAGSQLDRLFEGQTPGGVPASTLTYTPPPAPDPTDANRSRVAIDEDVQFTVYRPRTVAPDRWYPLLAFAHLSGRPVDAPPGAPDPVEEVQRLAEKALGAQAAVYQATTQDSAQAVPREETITLIPVVAGVEFNPARRSFHWVESVHREEFRLRASTELEGRTAKGRLSVFLGSILLAEVTLSFRVDGRSQPVPTPPMEPSTARPFRRIYASYAPRDRPIVDQFEQYARMIGDEYLSRCAGLRAGDVWENRLHDLITEADVFQLFWSRQALDSPLVEREWRQALALGRPHFVRPVYWEEPFPTDPSRDLPPPDLRRLHFQRLDGGLVTVPPRDTPTPSDAIDALQPDSGSDFELSALEGSDAGSEVFAIDEDDVDQNAATGLGSVAIDDEEKDDGFAEAPSGETEAATGETSWVVASATLRNRYEPIKRLGSGAAGEIWLVRDRVLMKLCVLKVYAGVHPGTDSPAAERSLRRARSLAALDHPGIERVYDAGRAEGVLYFVTEYCPGRGLDAILGDSKPLPSSVAVAIAVQIGRALQAAHEKGVLHEDLKSAEVIVDDLEGTPRVKVTGWGQTAARDDDPVFSGSIICTPAYAAPEVLTSGGLSARSNLYSVGVMAYEMLTGRRPFAGNAVVLIHRHVHDAPPPFSEANPALPAMPELERLVLRCLSKRPEDRPASAGDLAEAFPLASTRDRPSRAESIAPARRKKGSPAPKPRLPAARRTLLLLAALLALAAAIAWRVLQR